MTNTTRTLGRSDLRKPAMSYRVDELRIYEINFWSLSPEIRNPQSIGTSVPLVSNVPRTIISPDMPYLKICFGFKEMWSIQKVAKK